MKRRLNNEEQLAKELGRFFQRLKKEVLKALDEYWSDYQMWRGQIDLICSPVHEAHREYYEILEKYIKREYKLGQAEAKRAVDRVNKHNRFAFKSATTMPIKGFINYNKDNGLFATSPKAERDLLNRSFQASERTMSRVDGQINQIITDGYRSGKGINDVGNQLTKRFDQLSSWEARRIARTEINTSHNVATVDTYRDMDVEYTQWIAAMDDRTRDTHAEVDGEIIPMGGKYSNGLGYPGDMSGPIEEWINCRCSNAPFVIPYGYMAPSFSPFRESDLIPINDEVLPEPTPEQLQENLTAEQLSSYAKYQEEIKNAQDILDSPFYTNTEKLQARTRLEYNTSKLNQLKMIANGKIASGLSQIVGSIGASTVSADTDSLESSFIDVSSLDFSESSQTYYVKLSDGVEVINGKHYLNGLEVHNVSPFGVGKISKAEMEEHNKQFMKQDENVPHGEPIDIKELYIEDDGHIDVDAEYNGVKFNEKTGKWELNGLEVHDYSPDYDIGTIYLHEVKEHNKQFEKAPEPIKLDDLKFNKHADAYIVKKEKGGMEYNPITGEYEYKGLIVKDISPTGNLGKIKESDIIEHNQKLGVKTKPKHAKQDKLTLAEIESLEKDPYGDYMIEEEHRVTYNEETGAWEYKGVELFEYDEVEHYGVIDETTMQEYIKSNNLQRNDVLDNKYVNSMDSIIPTKEGGTIYVVDKKTGKKFVYDEHSAYEYAQDELQRKVKYGENETNSTKHWGRYGHQVLNGLLYRIEKYGYNNYEAHLDKAIPLMNKIRKMHKENFKGIDANGEAIYTNQDKITKEINKLGKIIDNIPHEPGCGATLTNIKNAFWEVVYMDKAMIESPALKQNTFLVRFGHFSADLCEIGKKVNLEGYTSTTYESGAAAHFEKKMSENPNRWAMLIMADEGSSGIRLNNQFDALTSEREWCLPRDQEFEVVEFDIDARTVVLRVAKNPKYN